MNLSVIIPSRNDLNATACIQAIRKNDAAGIRIVVVDDGLSPHFAYPAIPGEKPFCFARNINLGIRAAGSDDVILLNDDALLTSKGGFSALVRIARHHPEYGLVSATTNVANNPAQRRTVGSSDLRATPKAVAFVCVFLPRTTIDRVGLLDERFTGSIDGEMIYGGEDDDYCYRARMAYLKIGIFDGCYVDHASLKSTFRPDGKGLSITATRKRFREIHGFEMGTQ